MEGCCERISSLGCDLDDLELVFLGRVDRQSMNNTPGGSMHVFPSEVRQDRGFLGWLFARMLLGMHTCFPSQRSQEYCVSLFVLEGETRITKRCLQSSSLIWRDS